MALEAIRITAILPADPLRVYDAWLDEEEHTAFTGHRTSIDPTIGGAFHGGDGFYQGQILWLDPGRRIVQSWRTAEFPELARHSVVELWLFAHEEGAHLELIHREIPQGLAPRYEEGWRRYCLEPLASWLRTGMQRPTVGQQGAAAPTN